MFLYFLRTFQFFLMKFCRLCYWYYCDGHYTKEISFSFMPLCWGSFWGIYEPIFFISWEPFNICTYVFGVTVTVTTLIFFTSSPSLLMTIFGVFFGHFKGMSLHYLRTNHYFLIRFYMMFFVLIWQLLYQKNFKGILGMVSLFRVFFCAVKKYQYFLMLLCTELPGNTLMVTKQNWLRYPLLAHFWYILECIPEPLENHLRFSYEFLSVIFIFWKIKQYCQGVVWENVPRAGRYWAP